MLKYPTNNYLKKNKFTYHLNNNILCVTLVLICCFPFPGFCSSAGKLLPRGHGAYSIWEQDFFRIKFMIDGAEAVPTDDANQNGYPDFIEDLATQLVAAHHVFCETGGFPAPLSSLRYSGAEYVYVVVRDPAYLHGVNGIAFDEPGLQPDPMSALPGTPTHLLPKKKVLTIGVSNQINPRTNLTPAHEYFHQIQNGVSYFKNPWFYEGMAVWSESCLVDKTPSTSVNNNYAEATIKKIITDPVSRQQVFQASYAAYKLFWHPVAFLCKTNDIIIDDTNASNSLFQYTDGTYAIQSRRLPGGLAMRSILLQLGETDKIAFKTLGHKNWSEANQRHMGNSPFILDVTIEVLSNMCGLTLDAH